MNNKEKSFLEIKEELLKKYCDYELILNTLNAIVIAVLLNRKFVENEMIKLKDELNNECSGLYQENLKEIPKITNIIYIIASGIFFIIESGRYDEALKNLKDNENCEEVNSAWTDVISALLVFIAVNLSDTNLEV